MVEDLEAELQQPVFCLGVLVGVGVIVGVLVHYSLVWVDDELAVDVVVADFADVVLMGSLKRDKVTVIVSLSAGGGTSCHCLRSCAKGCLGYSGFRLHGPSWLHCQPIANSASTLSQQPVQ